MNLEDARKLTAKGYQIVMVRSAYALLRKGDVAAIRCKNCGMVSHNPNDVRELYCGKCHVFHPDR